MGVLTNIKNLFRLKEERGREEKTPGRNDPCWCGSGKKYKRCHLKDDERMAMKNCSSCGPT